MSGLADLVAAGATGFTALVFARAAWHKLADFTEFTGFVADYRLLPERRVPAVAAGLAAAEVATAAALVVPGGQVAGAVLAIALYLLYAGAMAINIGRGHTRIECGCGGTPTLLSPALVARNAVLAAIAALVTIGAPDVLSFGEAFAAVAAAFTLWLVFLLAEQLLANAGLAGRPR